MMLAAQRQRTFFPTLFTSCCPCCPGDGRAVALIVWHWAELTPQQPNFSRPERAVIPRRQARNACCRRPVAGRVCCLLARA